MDALIAGFLLVTTVVGSPAVPPGADRPGAATATTLREAAARPDIGEAAPLVIRLHKQARVSRFSKVERAIAIGAGSVVGFYAGALVGWKATDNPSNPNDDTSGLRGVVIGAPVGAVVGGILGYVFTR